MNLNKLHKLGLGKNEAIVYASLFELGKVKAQAIIKATKLHPNLVYPALKILGEKRLVSKVEKGKVAVFEANSPEALVRLMDEKKDLAREVADEFKNLQINRPRELMMYEGVEGVIQTRERALEELQAGDKFYVMGASHNTGVEMEKYWKKFNKKIIAKGVDYRLLFDKEAGADVLEQRAILHNIHARHLPFAVETPMYVAFYNDTINISIGRDDIVTFSLRNREAVEAYKKYFEYFWNKTN